MDILKKQFSDITKEVRVKNNLSQEQFANQLNLGGKQIIYYYEKAQRIMKLPEFIQFIQEFNETVLVDKNGTRLIDVTKEKQFKLEDKDTETINEVKSR